MGLRQLVQVQVCHSIRSSSIVLVPGMSSSQANNVVYDSIVTDGVDVQVFQQDQEDVQMTDAQPSIIMSDTFAVLAPSPQASPVPSPFPILDQWETRSRPDMEADSQNVPVPESESDEQVDEGVQDENLVQEEAEEEEVPDEEVEEEDEEYYQPQDGQEEDEAGYRVGDTRYRSYRDRQSFQKSRLDDGEEWRGFREGARGTSPMTVITHTLLARTNRPRRRKTQRTSQAPTLEEVFNLLQTFYATIRGMEQVLFQM
eukprot:377306-Amphidinium_carterae.1